MLCTQFAISFKIDTSLFLEALLFAGCQGKEFLIRLLKKTELELKIKQDQMSQEKEKKMRRRKEEGRAHIPLMRF
jgi:predicted nucleic acid-binding protein